MTREKNIDCKVFVIVEFIKDMKWTFTCIVPERKHTVAIIMEHLRKQINGPLTLFLAENKRLLNPNKVVGELYEENYNREDKMLYIMALLSNPY